MFDSQFRKSNLISNQDLIVSITNQATKDLDAIHYLLFLKGLEHQVPRYSGNTPQALAFFHIEDRSESLKDSLENKNNI